MQWFKLNIVICYTLLSCVNLERNTKYQNDIFNGTEYDEYLHTKSEKESVMNFSSKATANGCTFKVREHLVEPQPVFIYNNNYLTPSGTEGEISVKADDKILVSCTGIERFIQHPNINGYFSTVIATCVNNAIIEGDGWLSGPGEFSGLKCNTNPAHTAQLTDETCWNDHRVIRVGYTVQATFYPLFWSCYDMGLLQPLYVWYPQTPENAMYQISNSNLNWQGDLINVDMESVYRNRKEAIAKLVGSELAEKYLSNNRDLSRGHLAARTDFVLSTGQLATYHYINAAPQWQPFNGANWNLLEQMKPWALSSVSCALNTLRGCGVRPVTPGQNLRILIANRGFKTIVYTGTFGISKLRNQNNNEVDIYLHHDFNNNPQVPVPMYFYKVVHDESRRVGTAFIGINNPHYTLGEAQALQFCNDHCRGNSAFDWIGWNPDNVENGYSFCCEIEDFRKTVPHLPDFRVNGLLKGDSTFVKPTIWVYIFVSLVLLSLSSQ